MIFSIALEYLKPILAYWKLIALGVIVVAMATMGTEIYVKNLKIAALQSAVDLKDIKINALGSDLKLSNDAALKNKADYDAKSKELPKEIIKIHTVYVDKVNTIETITEDKNDTCEQMVAKLNDTDL